MKHQINFNRLRSSLVLACILLIGICPPQTNRSSAESKPKFTFVNFSENSTTLQKSPCDCPDKKDMLYRIKEIEAAIAEYKNQIKLYQAANTMFTDAEYRALQTGKIQSVINAVFKAEPAPKSNTASADTGGSGCDTVIKGGTACLRAAIDVHESFHRGLCKKKKGSLVGDALKGFPDYRKGNTMAAVAQEEIDAYLLEINYLKSELTKLDTPKNRCEPCDGQWHGTITYTYVSTSKGNSTHSRKAGTPRPRSGSSDGGSSNQDLTITYSGTVAVNGNEWLANSLADYRVVTEESESGKFACSMRGVAPGQLPPLVASSSKRSEVTSGGGSAQGKTIGGISLDRDYYKISIKPLTVNGTLQSTTQTSSSGGCPPAKPPTSYSNSQAWQFGLNDYISGTASYGNDRNILSGSFTETSPPRPSPPAAIEGKYDTWTRTSTYVTTVTKTITWSLRRCNK